MGDFVTNSQTSLTNLYDQCTLLQNVLHDILVLQYGEKVDQVLLASVAGPANCVDMWPSDDAAIVNMSF